MGLRPGSLLKVGARQASEGGSSPLSDLLLRLIWKERRVSRADLARRADISRSTVSDLIKPLLRTGLVAEVGAGQSRGGRRPIVLEFQDEAFGILGVDIGAAHVAVALADLRGQVLAWKHAQHEVRSDPEGTRRVIAELSDGCLAQWGGGTGRLVGVGIAVPSPVNPAQPRILSEVALPAWRGHDWLDDLQVRYGVPVLVDNDANLGALAERWWGAGLGVDDFVYIKVATGIGAGQIVGGEIYRGATGIAGEVGHLVIDPLGPKCPCGLAGCLTTLVGSRALIERAAALAEKHPKSALGGSDPTVERIADAAVAGDPLARQVVHEAAEHLGIALAGIVSMLNPAMVIVGGGLTRVGELLLDPLRDVIGRRSSITSVAGTQVRASDLGERATALGAATIVLQAALDDPRLFPKPQGVRSQ
ncbi:MAG: ROK family transcriptional regulator [marine benthic group bacterium]|jgi:glucokinase-like ROK family protein|nr:ROK family transcriptional regulator [Candidatus Benthicola marisminoris]